MPQGKKLFFHFPRPSDGYFSVFGRPNMKSTHPKKQNGIGCYGQPRCQEENRWMMKRQYPEKGCYFCHKLRDVFGKLNRTFLFSLFNATQGNVEIVDHKILNVVLFFFGFVDLELFSSFV